jgi:group I intron endonuclease
MKKVNAGIYKIVNLKNNKVYVGSAVYLSNRFSTHKYNLRRNQHHSRHLQSAWNEYGEENFIFEVLEHVEKLDLLVEREQFWLDNLMPHNKNIGYNTNILATSSLGVKHTEQARKNMSESAKRKNYTNPKFENSPYSKLTWDEVNEIREEYAKGGYVSKRLAKEYGLSDRYVRSILNGECWNKDGIPPVKKPDRFTQDQINDILLIISRGASWNQIGLKYQCEYRLIKRFLNKKGILHENTIC